MRVWINFSTDFQVDICFSASISDDIRCDIFLLFQANVVLKEKETFIEYLQKQLNEAKGKLDSEVSRSCFYAKIAKPTTLTFENSEHHLRAWQKTSLL